MALEQKKTSVLRSIFSLHRATIKDISSLCNLNPLVVTSIVNNLERAKIVARTDKIISGPGRPTIVYDFNPFYGCALGIAVTENSMRISKINFAKDLAYDKEILLDSPISEKTQVSKIIDRIVHEAKRVSKSDTQDTTVLCVGLSVPGMVDTEKGIWTYGHQMPGVMGLKLRDELEARLELPTIIEDDARTLIMFHKLTGCGISHSNFVLIYLGWGVGAGVVIANALYRGCKGLAGEIGHLIVDKHGRQCTCGSIGCLQTVASEKNIIRLFSERLQEDVLSTLNSVQKDKPLSLQDILLALEENDKLARSIIFSIGRFVGDACSDLIKLFNPEILIITGSVARLSKFLREPIDIKLRQNVMQIYLDDFDIVFTGYDSQHESIGAALLSIQNYLNMDRD